MKTQSTGNIALNRNHETPLDRDNTEYGSVKTSKYQKIDAKNMRQMKFIDNSTSRKFKKKMFAGNSGW